VYNSKSAQSYPPSACPNLLTHGLQVYLKLAQFCPPSVSSNSLDYGHQVCMIVASKCIHILAQSQSRSTSPSWLHHAMQVLVQIPSITTSKWISKLSSSWPWSVSLSSLDCHFQVHLKLHSSTAYSQSRDTVCRWVAIEIHIYIIQNRNYIHEFQSSLNDMQQLWFPGAPAAFPQKMLLFADCCTVIWGAPRLVASDSTGFQNCSRHSQDCFQCSQVYPKFSLAHQGIPQPITITPMVLLYQSLEITVTLKACRNAHLRFDTPLKLTYLSLHSTFSHTLVEAPSECNTFFWCRECVAFSFDNIVTQYLNYEFLQPTGTQVTQDGRGNIVDAAFTLIFWIGKGVRINTCWLYGQPEHRKRTMMYQS